MSTKKELKLLEGADAIGKAITSIGNRGAKLDNDVQLAGLSVIAHIEKHGDVTLADRLYNALSKGSRRNALASWMMDHGKLSLPPEDAETQEGRVFVYDKTKTTKLADAEQVHWTEYKHSDGPVTAAFDAAKAMQSLLKRIADARKAGRQIEGLEEMRKLAGALASQKE